MGSYTTLTVAEYPLYETKSFAIPEVMTIFRERDKRTLIRKLSKQNTLVLGTPGDTDRDEEEAAVTYSCLVRHAIDRLNVMGFTASRVRDDFEAIRGSEIDKLESWEDGNDGEWFKDDLELFRALRFEGYAAGLRFVLENQLLSWPLRDHERTDLSPVVRYMLRQNNDYHLGFLGSDARALIRLACDLVDPDAQVVQDLSEVVDAGYYNCDDSACDDAVQSLTAGHPENAPRIILAEGSTDLAILRDSLELLYPHLVGYYSFLDLDSSRSPGGAGYLVSIVKAFAAAGISNRVIALFDNDTAAAEARRALDQIRLPENIAVLNYPPLELLQNYPTLGPGGRSTLDINGLAASIELYLGEDILAEGSGLAPVQWKGYCEPLGKYQGEVLHKARIHATFRRKLERAKANPGHTGSADWTGLQAIWAAVFDAFR